MNVVLKENPGVGGVPPWLQQVSVVAGPPGLGAYADSDPNSMDNNSLVLVLGHESTYILVA